MDQLTYIVREINSILWGPWCLIPILVGTGIFYTFQLRFVQIRQFGRAFKHVFGALSFHGERAGKHGMTSFQSLATAVAAQVGTGNLAGVATAIAMGGPGAIFWMWLAAFFGMATIFAEAVLGQLYRSHDSEGHIGGGPAYYISKGIGSRSLAVIFSVILIIALGFVGNMVQANSISTAFESAFHIPTWVSGLFIITLAGFIFIGGISRVCILRVGRVAYGHTRISTRSACIRRSRNAAELRSVCCIADGRCSVDNVIDRCLCC